MYGIVSHLAAAVRAPCGPPAAACWLSRAHPPPPHRRSRRRRHRRGQSGWRASKVDSLEHQASSLGCPGVSEAGAIALGGRDGARRSPERSVRMLGQPVVVWAHSTGFPSDYNELWHRRKQLAGRN